MPEDIKTLKVRLKVRKTANEKLRRCMGCARRVHNELLYAQNLEYEEYFDEIESRLIYGEASSRKEAKALCKKPEPVTTYSLNEKIPLLCELYPFLASDAHSQVLQQAAQRLAATFKRYFKGKGGYPHFAKKNQPEESIRYPQSVRFDFKRRQISLPKLGWFNFFNKKFPKDFTLEHAKSIHAATIVREGDCFYACFEYRVNVPETQSLTALMEDCEGLDRGVVIPIQLSDGTKYATELKERTERYTERIKELERSLKHKTRNSRSWKKTKNQIAKLHKKICNIKNDILHKATSEIAKNHSCICMEALKLTNMTKSARGTKHKPGSRVKQKAGLNREMRLRSLGKAGRMLDYKLKHRGGMVVLVPPQYTSQTCSNCGYVSAKNRKSQASFVCERCGRELNADLNAALNIKRAGLAQLAEIADS